MTEVALYDLSPALRLMLMGLAVALGPLAWVWLRSRQSPLPHRLRVLTLVTLFLTFDLVLFGAFTRLTDSGLGCPDWPGCYGKASPLGAHAEITQAQSAMPTGPVTLPKAWIEMIHRYLATGVGVLILTLAAVTWLAYRRARLSAPPGAHGHTCHRQLAGGQRKARRLRAQQGQQDHAAQQMQGHDQREQFHGDRQRAKSTLQANPDQRESRPPGLQHGRLRCTG